jgi:hypothetical protein
VRAPVVAAVRLAYALSGVCWGLQTCSTVTKWVAGEGELESPFSALLWRPGVIALVWHAAAFRLPFWQHVAVQGATAAAYCACLAEPVCASLASVQYGAALAGLAAFASGVWWVLSQLLSMAAVGGAGVLTEDGMRWLIEAIAPPAARASRCCGAAAAAHWVCGRDARAVLAGGSRARALVAPAGGGQRPRQGQRHVVRCCLDVYYVL